MLSDRLLEQVVAAFNLKKAITKQEAEDDTGQQGSLDNMLSRRLYGEIIDQLAVGGFEAGEDIGAPQLLAQGLKSREKMSVHMRGELTGRLRDLAARGAQFKTHQEIAQALGLRQSVVPITGSPTGWKREEVRGTVNISASEQAWDKFGQLKLENDTWPDSGFRDDGLHITLEVKSNPQKIWKTGDLVELSLQRGKKGPVKLGDLYIKLGGNAVVMTIYYTYPELESMMSCKPGSISGNNGAQKRQQLGSCIPQIGLLATWRTAEGKGEQHRSGGIDQKMGSGLINVLDVDLPMLEKTESIRNINWNESQVATLKRPIVAAFPGLIQTGKEISTTLEAESEYLISEQDFLGLLRKMEAFKAQKGQHPAYGLEPGKDVESEQKKYVDTYYDLDIEGGEANPLLESDIVFRRRDVPKLDKGPIIQKGDPEGTRLIAIKGRSVAKGGTSESLRLASQFEAQYDLLTPGQQPEILKFLRSEQKDNPFARTLLDALGEKRGATLDKAKGLKKSVTVTSTRYKYKLWMPGGTMIDLSIDEAEGEMGGYEKKAKVWSFEFGVGHPGLSTSTGGGGGLSEEDPVLNQLMAQQKVQQGGEKQPPWVAPHFRNKSRRGKRRPARLFTAPIIRRRTWRIRTCSSAAIITSTWHSATK
ncbi:MAG: hypothetical protein ACYDBJ_26565 [Aggregatilineales bacterium]